MKSRLIVVLAFLAAMTASVADAKWDWWEDAKPQKFRVFDEYVIAVGTEGNLVPVAAADVEKALQDGKEIRLKDVEIQGDLKFGGEIKRDVYFIDVIFTGDADFRFATFTGNADFIGAQFTGEANFIGAAFTGNAYFIGATFEKSSDFRCMYSEKSVVSFVGVTGFSQMKMEWKNDESGRGFRGYLVYDETFYIALIKNYRDMGWLSQADDVYYIYRQEKRKRRNALYSVAELAFVEIPFGYGVKPLMFLRSLLLVWLSFSCVYICFLRRKERWYRPYRCIRFLYRYGFSLVGWAVVHSLDNLTPGVDISSLSTMFMDKGICVFNSKSKAVIVAESVQKLLGWYLLALFLVMFGKIWVR